MRIAIIFPKDSEAVFNKQSSATFGGATAQLFNISKALYSLNNKNVYSIISDYEHIEFDDSSSFNLVPAFKNSDNLIIKIIKLHKSLKKIKTDVLIQRGLTLFSCLLALYCKIINIKFIFMFAHDNEIDGRYQRSNKKCFLFKWLLKYNTRLICQSDHQRERLFSKYKSESVVVKSGYFLNENSYVEREKILWVSRLEPWKRPELFLDLAKKFPEEKFVMIGPVFRGYEEFGKNIKNKTKKIKNLTYIDFVPFNKINDYFNSSKFFINTSEKEGFPNTFIQSFMNGVPVISLNVDPDNILSKNRCGFFCNDSTDELYMKLSELIKDKTLYKEISNLSYSYAQENHDIFNNAKQIIEIADRL